MTRSDLRCFFESNKLKKVVKVVKGKHGTFKRAYWIKTDKEIPSHSEEISLKTVVTISKEQVVEMRKDIRANNNPDNLMQYDAAQIMGSILHHYKGKKKHETIEFAVDDNGSVQGGIVTMVDYDGGIFINYLAQKPSNFNDKSKHKGVGKKLLLKTMKQAFKDKKYLSCTPLEHAMSFYKKFGFEINEYNNFEISPDKMKRVLDKYSGSNKTESEKDYKIEFEQLLQDMLNDANDCMCMNDKEGGRDA